MALDAEHLMYPKRGYGMDHDRYDWSMLTDRKPISWPQGKKLALWVNVCVQFFPLNQQGKPFAVPGGMTMPYPDLRHFSLREYGNRIGLFRILDALDNVGIVPTFAINGEMAQRNPWLLEHLAKRDNEILCHGWNMDSIHYGGMDSAQEQMWIENSLSALRDASGQPVTGWLSPARNESELTPELLKQAGVQYCANWVNDDMPYAFNTANGPIAAMPLSNELDDQFILQSNLHSEASYVEQIQDAASLLLTEAETQGGRMLGLNIHPWLLGQPYRIGYLERLLGWLAQQDIYTASASDILSGWQHQQAAE